MTCFSEASRLREIILTIYSALVRSYLECWVQIRASKYKRDMDILKRVQKRATRMMKRLEHVSCAKRLRELGLSRMEKVLWGELINVCKCLKGQCNEDRTETGSSQRCTVPQPEAMGPDSKPPNTGGFL